MTDLPFLVDFFSIFCLQLQSCEDAGCLCGELAWDVDKIQAHLWNSVAGINVGMGYFFYFVGVV